MEKFLTYEEYGAVGDGVTDDMEALCRTHTAANELNLPVRAKDGATYYIGKKNLTMEIQTDTDFGTAKFIIDDRELENITASIINVTSVYKTFTPEIKSLTKNQKKIDFPHEGTVFVKVTGKDRMIYIRKGPNKNNGASPTDSFIVEADGTILTGINWDYPQISSAYAKRVDDKPITIKGGVFTTIANQYPSKYNYHRRNINVTRSNVTITKLCHYITGEMDHGAPYEGFIKSYECYNFLLKDVILTPHKTYYTESQIPGQLVGMGSYDLSSGGTINTRYVNVKQSIDVNTRGYWGLMGSSYCKNFMLEDCVVSRYDAHCGVTDGHLKNCELGSSGINLTGFGEFLIENCICRCGVFMRLREDYGAFFDGSIKIKNCTWYPYPESNIMMSGSNSGDHDYGYECRFPDLEIDGLMIEDVECGNNLETITILPTYDREFEEGKPFAYKIPERIVLKNITRRSGKGLKITDNEALYKAAEIITK